ncbi:molecular chaperone DnaJ [Limnoglobus roseus]|uniref:Chaperone protein DnaJ n=1 Tax=Limnoglobus roseus TaxID=2598579 RepID=A0A5C1ABH1_9BACT|nr:molecular chaperone DnaJ [Limnoglobus roseus]QEL16060.1 molecular chaperone DnaJ [Limnoglobus roseus]
MVKRDYYEVLSVTRTANGDEIKKSFRKLAMQYHPDRNGGDADATEKFKEAQEAFEVLSDADKRSIYDRHGHDGLNAQGGGFGGGVDLSEMFGDLFGSFFGGGGGGGRRQRQGPQPGNDIQVVVDIDLKEAVLGTKRTITLQTEDVCGTCNGSGAKPGTQPTPCRRCGGQGVTIQRQGIFQVQAACTACGGRGMINPDPCSGCRGNGRVASRKTEEIDIPPGVDSGNRIRHGGKGDAGSAGAPRGDLEVVVRVKEHRFFQRDGHNLICQWPVTFSQAALGGPIEITTLTGDKVRHELPRGLQTHEVLRILGHGVPHVRSPKKRGDLLIQVVVDTPQTITPEMEQLFRQLAVMEKAQVASPGKKSFFSKLKDWISPDEKK